MTSAETATGSMKALRGYPSTSARKLRTKEARGANIQGTWGGARSAGEEGDLEDGDEGECDEDDEDDDDAVEDDEEEALAAPAAPEASVGDGDDEEVDGAVDASGGVGKNSSATNAARGKCSLVQWK